MELAEPARFLWLSDSPPDETFRSLCAELHFVLEPPPGGKALPADSDFSSYAAFLLPLDGHAVHNDVLELIPANGVPILLLASRADLVTSFFKSSKIPYADYLLLSAPPELLRAKLRFLAAAKLRDKSRAEQLAETELKLQSEISARERSQEIFEKYSNTLGQLSRSIATSQGDLSFAVREACQAASVLGPDRITVWIYDETGTAVSCFGECRPPNHLNCSGHTLTAAEFPNYFAAFEHDRVCRVSDTELDRRGEEMRAGRGGEPPIRAFLAACFSVRDDKVGILRLDQLAAPRSWTNQDQAFVTSLADMLAFAFESFERQEALRQSEEKLRLILENATEFAVLLLDQNGIFTECNKGAEAILGYSEWEIIGQPTDLIFTEEDKAAAIPQKELLAAAQKGRSADERWHKRKDGSLFWGSGFMYSLHSERSDLLGFVKIIRDITDRKVEEDRTKSLNEELEIRVNERTSELKRSTEQMEAFCYTVSHDLRAPLRSMQSFATILAEEFSSALAPTALDLLQRIKASSHRMDALISDLLEYSRLGRLDLPSEQVDLEYIVKDALQDISAEIRARNAEVFIQHPLPSVRGNRAALTHVISNLLTNALKFSRQGVAPEIKIFTTQREDWVRFSVQDNGIGIAPEHCERIFRIFERLHPIGAYPGTGVGLAIVRKAIERLGGRSGVDSERGKGSTFWFELRSHTP
jgi:PAS domain S-box-containing protein